MKVLVTDGESRAALTITRSLGRLGHQVHVCSERSPSLAGVSRYCTKFHRLPARDLGVEALVQQLTSLGEMIQPDKVVGVADKTLAVIHERLESWGKIVVPPAKDDYFEASDKVALFRTCKRVGIPVPDGMVVEGGELPPQDVFETFGSPLVVRPAMSWKVSGDRWIHGTVFVADTYSDLRDRLSLDEAYERPYLVQKYIDGYGSGLFLFADSGRLLATFAHKRLREKPPWGGVSTLCESVAVPEDMEAYVRQYVETTGWSGLAMFEFKRERKTDKAYLLEVNARPWGSISLAVDSGIDFPRLQLEGEGEHLVETQARLGTLMRWWWGDVDHYYLKEIENGRNKLSAVVRGLFRCVCSGPKASCWDTFSITDPIPFLVDAKEWVRG